MYLGLTWQSKGRFALMRFLSRVFHRWFPVSVIAIHGQNAPYFYVRQRVRNMIEPQISEIYYRVYFADSALKIPCLEPMKFIGTNLFPEHEESDVIVYYFQYPTEATQDTEGEQTSPEYLMCSRDDLSKFLTLIEAVAKLSLVAAGVDLTRPPGSRGLDL